MDMDLLLEGSNTMAKCADGKYITDLPQLLIGRINRLQKHRMRSQSIAGGFLISSRRKSVFACGFPRRASRSCGCWLYATPFTWDNLANNLGSDPYALR